MKLAGAKGAGRGGLAAVALLASFGLAGCGNGASPAPTATPLQSVVPPATAGPAAPAASASASPAGNASPASPAGAAVELTIFAAASLTDAFDALAKAYEASHPGVTITLAFDASSALRAKIEQGARVDLFASADTKNPDALATAGFTVGAPAAFASNGLAVIVPASNPAGLTDPYGLAGPGVKVIAAGESVPITAYATELLQNLEAYKGAQADFIPSYERNIVSREDNVRGIVAKVELGEGDAGIVYATDARSAGDKVKTLQLPPGTDVRAAYAAVVLKDAPNPGVAATLLAWLGGPEAQGILASFGFGAP